MPDHADLHARLEQTAADYGASWFRVLSTGEAVMIVPLFAHVALYIEPDGGGGYDDRYCLSNEALAIKATLEYEQTGVMRYWQKHHNRNESVAGCHVYGPGVPHLPQYALRQVDWDADVLREQYPYVNPRLAAMGLMR